MGISRRERQRRQRERGRQDREPKKADLEESHVPIGIERTSARDSSTPASSGLAIFLAWRGWPFWDRWLTILGFAFGLIGLLGLWLAIDATDSYLQPKIAMQDFERGRNPLGSRFRILNQGTIPASNILVHCTSEIFDYRAGDDGPPLGTGAPQTTTIAAPFSRLRPGDGFEVMCDVKRARQYWSADDVDVRFTIEYSYKKWRWPFAMVKPEGATFRFRSAETPAGDKIWTQLPFEWNAPPVPRRVANISEEALRRVIAGDIPLCDDATFRSSRSDVVGVMIESSPFDKSRIPYTEIFPTRVRGLKLNQRVTWEFRDPEWAPAWYRDPKTRRVKLAWEKQREFVGKPY